MQIDDVLERLHTDFGTIKSSARAYCDAPAFVIKDGWIRLRRDDEDYVYQGLVRDTAGVFSLGEGRVGLLFQVDQEILRGSGRPLGVAAGRILGIAPNDSLTFEAPDGTSLTVSFPDTTISGPSLGSTRVLATAKGSRPDDFLNLVLDRRDLSVSATVTTISNHDPGWRLVGRLTGIDPEDGLEGLAASLQCDREEVESVLRGRGDDVLADALPGDVTYVRRDQAPRERR